MVKVLSNFMTSSLEGLLFVNGVLDGAVTDQHHDQHRNRDRV